MSVYSPENEREMMAGDTVRNATTGARGVILEIESGMVHANVTVAYGPDDVHYEYPSSLRFVARAKQEG
jgi:hypothetical protein